jgi:hypothetical protein
MKDVDRVVEDLFKQKEALGVGQSKILRTGPEAMTPKGLQNFEASGGHAAGPISPGQADMLKAGTRADVERMVGTNANDVAALRKMVGGEGDWNRAKLAQIFGPDEADKVINAVDREVAFKDAVNKLATTRKPRSAQGAAQYVDKPCGPRTAASRSRHFGRGSASCPRRCARAWARAATSSPASHACAADEGPRRRAHQNGPGARSRRAARSPTMPAGAARRRRLKRRPIASRSCSRSPAASRSRAPRSADHPFPLKI